MKYPIFNSVVNRIESDLQRREISIQSFRTWDEDRINATGLEIKIDVSQDSDFIKAIAINFDWDRFRETVLAKQLKGMEEHPFLQEENMVSTSISPDIDIEVTWLFNERASNPDLSAQNGYHKVEAASQWMEEINHKVNDLLADDDIISRWHVEVDGTPSGKYLTAVNLLSYFQYTFSDLNSLNEVHKFVLRILQELLIKSNRVIKLADHTLHNQVAA
ncbi:hypothetical protein LQ318_01365 [Aliifodinibius salicampi]|uniref:Uncharacterized protein n=1 Tax=Fodinibius salicampi TaxID=1920655 RepID=A0ABT3PUL7_9BACT|nr:hypothetical protein [Fodinibius salicampi]MCW9711539.1 hypothetical protein [Fodinibius salicampi]